MCPTVHQGKFSWSILWVRHCDSCADSTCRMGLLSYDSYNSTPIVVNVQQAAVCTSRMWSRTQLHFMFRFQYVRHFVLDGVNI